MWFDVCNEESCLLCLLLGDGIRIKTEWGKRRDYFRWASWTEARPQRMDSPSSWEIHPERPQESCHQSHFPSCFQRHSLCLRGRNNKGEVFLIFCGLSSTLITSKTDLAFLIIWCDQWLIKFRLNCLAGWHNYSVLSWMSCTFDCRQPLSFLSAVLVIQGLLRHTKNTSLHRQCDNPMVISPVSGCLLFITVPSNRTQPQWCFQKDRHKLSLNLFVAIY